MNDNDIGGKEYPISCEPTRTRHTASSRRSLARTQTEFAFTMLAIIDGEPRQVPCNWNGTVFLVPPDAQRVQIPASINVEEIIDTPPEWERWRPHREKSHAPRLTSEQPTRTGGLGR